MHVAVLGGGLVGCCTALALADRGVNVTLYDRNAEPMSRAALANEGKIHLGYLYAGDPSLASARAMLRGALSFEPLLARYVGLSTGSLPISTPTVYIVHRDSQKPADEIAAYLARVHDLVREAADAPGQNYFGADLRAPLRAWPRAERESAFDGALVRAAFDTPELAIDPAPLAVAMRLRLADTERIELRLCEVASGVEDDGKHVAVASVGPAGATCERYDQAVNALWDGRLKLDATLGLRPRRHWLHRLKYGVRFRPPPNAARLTVTAVLGPLGEAVAYDNGVAYVTWYPVGMQGRSDALSPPDWPTFPDAELSAKVAAETLAAIRAIAPSFVDYTLERVTDLSVRGGTIVAWGETDIDDPQSELHQRYDIGVWTTGRYHSVDPGKLTLAPYFAELCAARISGSAPVLYQTG